MKKYSDIDWNNFVTLGKMLVGKPYIFGAKEPITDKNPDDIKAIDCSGLVEWLYAVGAGVVIPDGSYNQDKLFKSLADGSELLVGDLGFKWHPDTHVIHHVGVFIGSNTVLEAKGHAYGTILTAVDAYIGSHDFAHWSRHPDFLNA